MKDIIVFGTGKYFEHKKEVINRKYNITCFLDNKVQVGGQELYEDTDIKIKNPADFDKESDMEIFLMSVHFISMWKQLCSMGVEPKRIVFPYMEQPYFENEMALCDCLCGIDFFQGFFICTLKDGSMVKIADEKEWRVFLQQAYRLKYPLINAVAQMGTEPISRQFGTERGTPIDRFYINRFMESHKGCIQGDVLEIEEPLYTRQFGSETVCCSIVMDVDSKSDGITFNGNLETGEGIQDGIADCFILTQTLMYIFDLKSAAHNIGRLLKQGGTALITCSGISQNSIRCMDNYGCYFNFNETALGRIFEDEPMLRVVETASYGNVKTVTAHLNGLCSEDLVPEDFEVNDRYYPLVVCAVVEKCEKSRRWRHVGKGGK